MLTSVFVEAFRHRPSEQAWKFFWVKYVEGVDLSQHCQNCLLGTTSKKIRTRFIAGATEEVVRRDIWLNEDSARVLYFCGVSDPYVWERNFHLAVKVVEGAKLRVDEPGVQMSLINAEKLTIDELHLDRAHPMASHRSFSSCRNWQFAWAWKKGVYGQVAKVPPPTFFDEEESHERES